MHIIFVIIEFAIVLGIMVLIHELGHFIVAKLCGVRVETFSIGFGPRVVGFRHGDTDYRISALPLGGYVKMAGDEPGHVPGDPAAPNDEAIDVLGIDINPAAGEFNAQPRWQRVLIALSGPIANFLLAFFLLTLVAHYHHEVDTYLNGAAVVDYVPLHTPAAQIGMSAGDTITRFNNVDHPTWVQIINECQLNLNHSVPVSFEHNGKALSGSLQLHDAGPEFTFDFLIAVGLVPREQDQPLGVDAVTAGTPGDRAGLQTNDGIAQIDNLQIHSLDTLIAYLQDQNGAPATLLVLRNNQPITLRLTPEKGDNGAGSVKYLIGFRPRHVPTDVQHLPLGAAISQSLKDNKDNSKLTLRVLKGMFTRRVSVRSLSGPVGIAQQIDLATRLGRWSLFELMANISLQLGIFNLLPLPILDGGMILFLLVESIMRRDVNVEIKERVYQVAFVCFILFAAFVLFNDVTKLHH